MLSPSLSREACRLANLSAWPRSPNTIRSVQRRFLSSARPTAFTPASIRQTISRTASALRLPVRIVRADSTLAAGSQHATAGAPTTASGLTWNRFLELRKIRRRISLVSSVLFGIGCMVAGGAVVLSKELEVKVSQTVGIDQFITLGALFVICFTGGWLIGPFFGNAVFNMRFRSMRKLITEKEKEFFERIKKNRVDPTSGSYSNPVPDYYGEKIGSVRDYRRWLKDQRAFNLKRQRIL